MVNFSKYIMVYKAELLKPYHNYTFEVNAFNDVGVSDIASVSVETLQDSKYLLLF